MYGAHELRCKATQLPLRSPVTQLLRLMQDTMRVARGLGLAAPQIGQCIRVFLVDTERSESSHPEHNSYSVFINPEIRIDRTVPAVGYQEGCLSIPDVLVNVPRHERVTVRYFDGAWKAHERTYTGLTARVIQHEYDHLEGKLHIDYVSSLRKQMLRSKLRAIRAGKVDVDYPIRTADVRRA